ncbi:hypothetical protein M2451_002329 [Dysgonomonas sp. PFB1-18]|uniref:hypothetical protein n=1 Tax=unclassified Dysgonomonas TaxID=2630389 RepID=UPI00247323B7|nr:MULTISPECIES: hypothetical protein [unclassified Dysgonomonas]MDH6307095.1 hypothetical protein [Dysgonomonas sp. PF1-14]MDH6337014.1 hypothetical protein [Dysgonomonas sp. PF1-16]MDH6381000.1 hypothetical protein [Dysgonomonas sp. PFB1-18]MDH6396421.1 hypothetical protein [Dysgonomonas sp. PF1-23]
MKRIIIILILAVMAIAGYSQCNQPYKALSEFNKDTTAFIIYNFMDRADYYKGKTIKEVSKDLQIPIKDYTRNSSARGGYFTGIYIFI